MDRLWYWCVQDYCLRYRTPTELLPGEPAECSACGAFMHGIDAPPGINGVDVLGAPE